jgi:hypothetical protein
MFTGDEPYSDLLRLTVSPASLSALVQAALRGEDG